MNPLASGVTANQKALSDTPASLRGRRPSARELDAYTLDSRYVAEKGVILLSGVEALVRLFVDQHRFDIRNGLKTATLVSGYPGSPLATLDLVMRREHRVLTEHEVILVPGVNEELAASAVWGTQQTSFAPNTRHDGVIGIWYGKGPGLDRCGDVFRHANNVGVAHNGGVLVLAGDDPSQKSSTIPSHSEVALFDVGMPILVPGNVQDILDFGLHGVALSRYSGLWVGFQILTDVADGMGTAEVDAGRITVTVPELHVGGSVWRHQPLVAPGAMSVQAEREIFLHRIEAARLYLRTNNLNRITVNPSDARLGIVAAGKTYFDLRQALHTLGLDDAALVKHGVRLLKLAAIWPLERGIIEEFVRGVDTVLVVEEKRGFIEMLLRDLLYGSVNQPKILGKFGTDGKLLVPPEGELTSDRLLPVLGTVLGTRPGLEFVNEILRARQRRPATVLPLALDEARHSFFCSGCPHNRSTVVPEGSVAGGGIGCHTMALSRPRNEGLMQMGGEGANWIGRAPFTDMPHIFQNLGDGTYFHSGVLAIRASVAARTNITFKLLYNSAIAMTGGQPAAGGFGVPSVAAELMAEGVSRVVVVVDDIRKYKRGTMPSGVRVEGRDALEQVQLELREVAGTTVMIYDQACAAELRRKRKRGDIEDPQTRIFINESVCEGCGDCGVKSNCLSVHPVDTEFGRKTRIHQSSCNKDYSCIDGDCPSFVKVVPRGNRKVIVRSVPLPSLDLPEPSVVPRLRDSCSILMAGIGGTGVITVNHVLGMAAVLEGFHVAGLDQTGASQKAGPVVSHLKLSTSPIDEANSIGSGGTDCFLGLDPLVAADLRNLGRADPIRTIAVVSLSKVPTGRMVADVNMSFPSLDPIVSAIAAVTDSAKNVYLDSEGIAEALFGDHMAANLVVVGAAYQAGLLPISANAIERALRLNGVSVDMNLAAFRWGRTVVCDPEAVRAATAPASTSKIDTTQDEELSDYNVKIRRKADALLAPYPFQGELRRIVAKRVPDLLDYQNAGLAEDYLRFVARVSDAESAVASNHTAIAEAVAHNLYKLMAYKDEYEVARLYLRPSFRRQLQAEFGNASITYLLHPPFLRAFGFEKKIAFGEWFGHAFRALRALRILRGTSLDPFGKTKIRRLERALVGEYIAAIENVMANLDQASLERALQVARMPDVIRGYEDIKLRGIETFRRELAELMF